MPTFKDLENFLKKDFRNGIGWEKIRTTDHDYYEKILPNGEILRTKVSLGKHKEISANLFKNILKHQLHVSKEEFSRISKS